MHHYVYWLFDATTSELLYIGRSHEPARRKRDFERVYGRPTISGGLNRYTHLEDAQVHEIEMILRHWPPYNKRAVSSPASFGKTRPPITEETRVKLRAAKAGRKLDPAHKAAIADSLKGNTRNLGRIPTEATRLKMSISQVARRARARME